MLRYKSKYKSSSIMNALSEQSSGSSVLSRLLRDKMTCFCLCILMCYTVITILVGLKVIAKDWNASVGESYERPNLTNYFGTDVLGRSVLYKVLHGIEIAMGLGFVVTIASVFVGVLFGALAGYVGGFLDECIVWVYTVLSAIPSIIFLMVVPFVLGKGVVSICISMILFGWMETYRLVRGEVLRHKSREYIQAASAIGATHFRKLFVHILPNILALIVYQCSTVFQYAIKYEVILSYLGLGVQNQPSWGIMINDARSDLLRGVWWELLFATIAMFLILLAFNVIADKLRDVFDPKLKGE